IDPGSAVDRTTERRRAELEDIAAAIAEGGAAHGRVDVTDTLEAGLAAARVGVVDFARTDDLEQVVADRAHQHIGAGAGIEADRGERRGWQATVEFDAGARRENHGVVA